MQAKRLEGLIAATYTPITENGQLQLELIPALVEHLLSQGVQGLYVCGSTGEGVSLSSDQRRKLARAYVEATTGRVPVIIQVGHNSLAEARGLAEHAQTIGADAISATCPSYFKINTADLLVDCMAEVAAGAPDLPFYYYHIPTMTGSQADMVEFLQKGRQRIPSLFGLKYTSAAMHGFQECVELAGGAFDVLWGFDEMLLGALATGAKAAIGSTYNIAAPLYLKIIDAFERGDMAEARRLQSLSVKMIRVLCEYPFHPAMKAVLRMQGFDVGPCLLPQPRMTSEQTDSLRQSLDAIGFFEWSQ